MLLVLSETLILKSLEYQSISTIEIILKQPRNLLQLFVSPITCTLFYKTIFTMVSLLIHLTSWSALLPVRGMRYISCVIPACRWCNANSSDSCAEHAISVLYDHGFTVRFDYVQTFNVFFVFFYHPKLTAIIRNTHTHCSVK